MTDIMCSFCKKIKKVSPSRLKNKNHFCNNQCYAEYQKIYPSNTGRTWLKKGIIPWNKNKFLVDNTKGRRKPYYTRLIMEVSDKPFCNRCKEKEAKVVHHIDNNFHNNSLDNLEPLCRSCHSIVHETSKTLPKDGGWKTKKLKIKLEVY